MDLNTLVISPEEAEEHLKHYEAQIASERTAEDDAIRAGYRAAKRGLAVISLIEAFTVAGNHENTLPRLAIARANAKECHVLRATGNHGWLFGEDQWPDNRGALVGKHTVLVNVRPPDSQARAWRGTSLVPIIPPQFRPNRRRIRGFHVLWEVEQWNLTPPTDPALLRHIRGDLWAVQAVWDLTDLERAVLSQRARS